MYKKQTPALLLSLALASAFGTQAWAQDVIVDFVKEGTANSQRQALIKGEDVAFEFVGSAYDPYGAYIYSDWDSYKMVITAPRNIAVIEYQYTPASGKNANLVASPGTISVKDADTRVWRGSSNKITITGTSSTTSCSITRLRLWFDASKYDPNASWEIDESSNNPYAADVNLAEDDTDYTKKDRVYASVNVLPHDGHGVPMAVVSDRKFQKTLQPYLEWKTQQGYEVKELYTDQIPGKRDTELAYAIREKLMAMEPRPAYVLLVGDIEEIPSFPGVGAADLYYGEYTDDYYPEAYVGRFSANTIDELQPQLDKTKYMAFLCPKDGEWLKHSLTINNITDDIAVMNPAAEFSVKYPLNFEGNTSRETTAESTAIKLDIDNGCSYVSFFGHGGPGQWSTNFSNSNVYTFANKNKYPLVFSMTCHAGNFAYNQQACLAEAFMQRKDAGAVAVIAATRPSRSDSNYRRFFGDKDGSQSASVGLLRSLFPCVGVEPSQRARTIGQALEISGLAVARNMHDDFVDNTEMYNLLGDPTYQPYITIPKANKLHASSNNIIAGRNVTVSTVPDAMVCLSKGRTVIAAAMADAEGKVVLHVPAATTLSGDCTLYTSAPGYNDLSRTVTLTAGNGTEEIEDKAIALANITHTDVISLATAGGAISEEWNGQKTIASTTSPARYLICAVNDLSNYANEVTGNSHWLNTKAPAEGIFMRNKYEYCSIVTTTSAGKARRVGIEWLHPAGQGEVIGIYGSNTPYTATNEAWIGNDRNGNAKGTKLGELVKGYNDELIINGDYKYLLFRAEPHRQFPTDEQSNVYIKSISIDWEATVPQCATPQIAYADGVLSFSCATKGATYDYGIAPSTSKKGVFVLTATAKASGYAPSAQATLEIDGSALVKARGDIDENGNISIADVVKLIDKLTPKK